MFSKPEYKQLTVEQANFHITEANKIEERLTRTNQTKELKSFKKFRKRIDADCARLLTGCIPA